MVTVRVPATTANLGPGFDTLGLALNLYNYIEVKESNRGLKISIAGEGKSSIATNKNNIVYQAMQTVFHECQHYPAGLDIILTNNIPVARGLGSSAAAIVGGVMAANSLAGDYLTGDQMAAIAAKFEGHPDNVIPALCGGLAVSILEQNQIIYRKIAPPEDLYTVVAIPDFHLSTKTARSVLPELVPLQDSIFNLGNCALLIVAFMQNDYELLGKVMRDKLHQPYRAPLIPGMDEVLKAAVAKGALGVALSGAGPTLIAFTKGKNTTIGGAMRAAFAQYGISCTIKELKPDLQGARIIA